MHSASSRPGDATCAKYRLHRPRPVHRHDRGCNECHTPGFMQLGMAIPESIWLTGMPVGWRGPWGTTYGSNLRVFLKEMDANTFIAVTRARNDRPPMPWTALHAMSDDDLRSLHAYVRQLGPTGQPAPT